MAAIASLKNGYKVHLELTPCPLIYDPKNNRTSVYFTCTACNLPPMFDQVDKIVSNHYASDGQKCSASVSQLRLHIGPHFRNTYYSPWDGVKRAQAVLEEVQAAVKLLQEQAKLESDS